MRRIVSVAVVVSLAAALPVAAHARSTGGCPRGAGGKWTLTSIASVQELVYDTDLSDGIASLDGNGDGYTCVMWTPGRGYLSQGKGISAFFWRDNTVRGQATRVHGKAAGHTEAGRSSLAPGRDGR